LEGKKGLKVGSPSASKKKKTSRVVRVVRRGEKPGSVPKGDIWGGGERRAPKPHEEGKKNRSKSTK